MGATLRKGFIFCLFATFVVAFQFVLYLLNSQILGLMDFGGWAFYLTSCVSHAACLTLPAYIIYVLFSLLRLPRVGGVFQVAWAVVLTSLVYVNEQVYQLYRFHINGFVINMITGPAAGEIFNFDIRLYARYGLMLMLVVAGYALVWHFIVSGHRRFPTFSRMRFRPRHILSAVAFLVGSTLFAHIYHIFASFYQKQSVICSERLLPYYFPTTSYGLMPKMLGVEPTVALQADFGSGGGEMIYPLKPITIADTAKADRPNVLLILIDSWNTRALTPDCMPNCYGFATTNRWFKNHISCSNGTKSSVFGIWYGISSYYWNMAESSHITPAMLDVARQEGYTFRNYPSATHLDPPFARVLFAKEKNLRVETPGNSSLERDRRITDDFISDISDAAKRNEPFFAFVFYDGPHSFELPDGEPRFKPTWEYADYSVLHNDIDPTPFWNLYRNTCFETDKCIGRLLKALQEQGLDKSTLVIITGDHSQEFNENKKNYWGHNGNFSHAQIGVPLILHDPMCSDSTAFTHRTTHYDISPTIMRRVFGVTNPEEDYSMGRQLTDTAGRDWHIVGSELNYGFIIGGDTILEKTAQGSLEVFDKTMNRVADFGLTKDDLKTMSERLNRFLKK